MNLWALLVSCMGLVCAPACAKGQHKPQVVVLMSTDRPDSNTATVAEQVVTAYQRAGVAAQLFKVTDFGAEFYAPTAYAQKPATFVAFNDAVVHADLVVLVTPEYNAMMPAPLARVVNLLSFPDSFQDKKYAIVSLSISPWAATRAYTGLKKVLEDLHATVQDDLSLKVAEVQHVTKGATIYSEHAQKVAQYLKK